MAKIHVVGEQGSFTWDATLKRFGKNNKLIDHPSQPELLEKLSIEKKDRIKDPSVIPIWNSNSGTITFHKDTGENLTAGTLKGDAGHIIDLWGRQIVFNMGVHGNQLLKDGGTVYSVAVANAQCSDFFNKFKAIKFEGSSIKTTNIAFRTFQSNKKDGDGLLCNIELLKQHNIRIVKGDFANPFNYTVFFGVNRYPNKIKIIPKISLGCFLMNLQGATLPTEFIDYWNEITKTKKVLSAKNVLEALPKINFILRYQQSKALILMEMPANKNLVNPWMDISGDSSIESLGQVGLLRESFSHETGELINKFDNNRKVVFYGKLDRGNCFWACPALEIAVHGFESELVKNCAKIQVIRLNNLLKDGINLSDNAKEMLLLFSKNEKLLKLAPDSKPEER